jgi:dihydrofolate reductase
MKIIGIVAVGKNLEIGKDGKLPWHYPADLSFFKRTTSGHVIVMGFNTWLSIGRPLPNRKNIVLSRYRSAEDDSVTTLRGLDDFLKHFGGTEEDIYLIGGAQIYKSFSNKIDEWFVTRIPVEVKDADAFMDSDFLKDFKKISEERLEGDLLVERFIRI